MVKFKKRVARHKISGFLKSVPLILFFHGIDKNDFYKILNHFLITEKSSFLKTFLQDCRTVSLETCWCVGTGHQFPFTTNSRFVGRDPGDEWIPTATFLNCAMIWTSGNHDGRKLSSGDVTFSGNWQLEKPIDIRRQITGPPCEQWTWTSSEISWWYPYLYIVADWN